MTHNLLWHLVKTAVFATARRPYAVFSYGPVARMSKKGIKPIAGQGTLLAFLGKRPAEGDADGGPTTASGAGAGATAAGPSPLKMLKPSAEVEPPPSLDEFPAELLARFPILQHLTEPTWRAALLPEFSKPYFAKLCAFLDGEKAAGRVREPSLRIVRDGAGLAVRAVAV